MEYSVPLVVINLLVGYSMPVYQIPPITTVCFFMVTKVFIHLTHIKKNDIVLVEVM